MVNRSEIENERAGLLWNRSNARNPASYFD